MTANTCSWAAFLSGGIFSSHPRHFQQLVFGGAVTLVHENAFVLKPAALCGIGSCFTFSNVRRTQDPRRTRPDVGHRAPAPFLCSRHGHGDFEALAGCAVCLWAAG